MPIVEDLGYAVKFDVTDNLLDFFDQNHIKTALPGSPHRWKIGEIVMATADARFHSYSAQLAGPHIVQLGAFSYSLGAFSPFIKIGRYCSISWNVNPMGPQHPTHYVTSSELLYRRDGFFRNSFSEFSEIDHQWPDFHQAGPTSIGHDVWIGQNVGGIKIGNGAVIGAGAVVVKDVPPYAIVGGVGAKHIRYRFDEETIQRLVDLEWWNYAIPAFPELSWTDPKLLIPQLTEAIAAGRAIPFESDLGLVKQVVETVG